MIDEVSFLRATFLVMLCVCPVANATDGYFSNGYGTQCKGTGRRLHRALARLHGDGH